LTRKLKITQKGNGSALLVIHGWGMNQSVWQPIAAQLEQQFRVYWLDLAGHGINRDIPLGDIEQISALIAAEIPAQTLILAWSLGGLIAQQIALQQPDKVKQLCLVASSPCFVQSASWQTAMPKHVLENFADSLSNDFSGTLSRFLALQFLGIKGVQTEIKHLRQQLLAHPPATQALIDGLAILQTADFNENTVIENTKANTNSNIFNQENTNNNICIHWILGRLDRLVPISVAAVLSNRSNNTVTTIAKAGHAPFISHPQEFMDAVLMGFLGANYVK
jgi:pimeloyl-[acyl-carrier protein] methyl ester esterase